MLLSGKIIANILTFGQICVVIYITGCDRIFSGDESGIITSPSFSLNTGQVYCTYMITVPKGRRITAELIEGKSIAQNCDKFEQKENEFNEKITVSVLHLSIIFFFS